MIHVRRSSRFRRRLASDLARRLGARAGVGTLAAALTAWGHVAHGSPGADPTIGRAVFTGAASPHGTAQTLNPAAASLSTVGTHVYVSASGGLTFVGVDRTTVALDGSRTDGPAASDWLATWGGAVALWSTSSAGAIGIYVERPIAEQQLADAAVSYHSLGGYRRSSAVPTLAASYRLGSRFAFGASIALTYNQLSFAYARDTALDGGSAGLASDCGGAPCGAENPLAAERVRIDAATDSLLSTSSLAYALGVVAEVAPDWWLGVSVRQPPATLTVDGTATLTAAPRDGGATTTAQASISLENGTSVDVGVRGRLGPGLELNVGAHWENLSRLSHYEVQLYDDGANQAPAAWTNRGRGQRDPVRVWAGVEQLEAMPDQRWVFGARLGGGSPEVSHAAMTPTTIAGWSVTGDLGAQLRVSDRVVVQLSYGLEWMLPAQVTNSRFSPTSQRDCVDAGGDVSTAACADVTAGYGYSSAAGDYRKFSQAARLGVRVHVGD